MQVPHLGLSALAATLAWVAAITPGQANFFDVGSLDPPSGYTYFYPTAINNAGEVVGTAVDSATGQEGAVIWRDGAAMELAVPGGSGSHGTGINDAGVVVGEVVASSGDIHAFVWDGEVLRDLGAPGRESGATAINASGVIVGYERDNLGNAHATVWERGAAHRLDRLRTGFSNAVGVDGLGLAVVTAYASGPGGSPESYLSDNGALAFVGAFQATAVNSPGQVIGYRATPLPELQGVLWQAGASRELGDGDSPLLPLAINDRGQVVGSTLTSMGDEHAAAWQDGQMFDLNDGLSPSSGWELWRATGISNAGQIVGYGVQNGQQRAFMLTPSTP